MVLDLSVMNAALSQIVDDLDTTIQGMQTAIALYTLVMAAFCCWARSSAPSWAATGRSPSGSRSMG